MKKGTCKCVDIATRKICRSKSGKRVRYTKSGKCVGRR